MYSCSSALCYISSFTALPGHIFYFHSVFAYKIFVFSIKFGLPRGESFENNGAHVPAGAIYLYGESKGVIDGITDFSGNSVTYGGGENRTTIRVVERVYYCMVSIPFKCETRIALVLPPSRNSDPGSSVSKVSSPLPTPKRALHFDREKRVQLLLSLVDSRTAVVPLFSPQSFHQLFNR